MYLKITCLNGTTVYVNLEQIGIIKVTDCMVEISGGGSVSEIRNFAISPSEAEKIRTIMNRESRR